MKAQMTYDHMITGSEWRITVLTDRLLRLEYHKDRAFVDSPTQAVVDRTFPAVAYEVRDSADQIEVVTGALHLYYDKQPFSSRGLYISLQYADVWGNVEWHYNDVDETNLKGTARTLDNTEGEIPLEDGIMSRRGYGIIDDSGSALVDEDGWIVPRKPGGTDLYFFGYGSDYGAALKDFYKLCGKTPLLPRYVLGNWWSRYYAYTEQSYGELMEAFDREKIPFSVAVLDMDWHITNPPQGQGSGWTGYTWDEEKFPDPRRFLDTLHKRGMHTTLNLHPADGVHPYEKAYGNMCRALGLDAGRQEKISFDVTDKEFMKAYFEVLHHPLEEMGVDFWWLDWQQGGQSKMEGLDPLWMLNYLHYKDICRGGRKGLTFSRYAGVGSHRYPVGFSGDSVSSWKTLDFQVYFTTTATNIGYSWWSHDIGGHMKGRKDDELIVRWIQFGVFSPIMRMHSTKSEFYGKEPWHYNRNAREVIDEFLRLRHRMIPYLHTFNYKTNREALPLIRPIYFEHKEEEAYQVPNEYYFGELICAPITQKADTDTQMAYTDVWLPEGEYLDIFTRIAYEGGAHRVYRRLSEIPVFAKAGTIFTFDRDYQNAANENPTVLEVSIVCGADGSFVLIEDDCGEMDQGNIAETEIHFFEDDDMVISVESRGDVDNVIPKERSYVMHILGTDATDLDGITGMYANGESFFCDCAYDADQKELTIQTPPIGELDFDIRLPKGFSNTLKGRNGDDMVFEVLQDAQIEYETKDRVWQHVQAKSRKQLLHALEKEELSRPLYGAILERL